MAIDGKCLLKIVFLIVLIGSRAEASQCKGTPLTDGSPTAILNWLKENNNKNKNIKDVICCMPKKFQKGYLEVHSSISAQESHYSSPRILFGNLEKDGIMFSISGGDPDLAQSNSIEVIIDNQVKGEIELYDIEYADGHKKFSGVNPPICLTCHSSNGVKGAGGPRTILNKSPWPRMHVRGITPFQHCSPDLAKLHTALTTRASKAIRSNPRFSCLKNNSGGIDSKFDRMLERFNLRRVAKEMQQLPNYHDIKYFLMGLSKNCIDYELAGDLVDPDDLFSTQKVKKSRMFDQPESWFTNSKAQLLNKKHTLSPEIDGLQSRNQFIAALDKAYQKFSQDMTAELKSYKKLYNQVKNGKTPYLPAEFGLRDCHPSASSQGYYKQMSSVVNTLPVNIQRFVYDSTLRTIERGQWRSRFDINKNINQGLARWAIEGFGGDASGWGMYIFADYDRTFLDAVKLLPEFQKFKDMPKAQACKTLKAQSLRPPAIEANESSSPSNSSVK